MSSGDYQGAEMSERPGPSEPEMEHYLRQAGWIQAKLYSLNWCDVPGYGPDTMVCFRVKQAVTIQVKRDRATIEAIQDRLRIVS